MQLAKCEPHTGPGNNSENGQNLQHSVKFLYREGSNLILNDHLAISETWWGGGKSRGYDPLWI